MGGDGARRTDRWRARPRAAAAVRAFALAGPLLAGLSAGLATAVAPVDPVAARPLAVVAGVAVVLGTRRLLRPLLALATLLGLGLTFPGPAPDRLVAGLVRARPARAVRAVRCAGTAADTAAALVVLLATVSAFDRRRRQHTRRVVALTDLLAERLGIHGEDRERLRWGALLHDVGLLTVAAQILDKAARPAPAQWQVLRGHPEQGARAAGPMLGWLGEWGAAVRHHHERWDGHGYPDGLSGGQIPRAARIVGLTDAYDSMTAARPYRAPLATRAALTEVVRCRGTQFDPAVVDAFLAVPLPRLLLASGPVALLANLPMLGRLARIGRQGVVAVAAPQAAMVAASTAVVLGGVTATGAAGTVPAAPGGAVAQTSAQTATETVTATRTATVTAPTTVTAPPSTAPPSTAPPSTAPPSTTTPATTPTTTGPTMNLETSTPATANPDPRPTAPLVPAQPTGPGSWATHGPGSTGSTVGAVGAETTDGPPTTTLPAVREPVAGPPAPRIVQQPPGATDLPAAGFSWAITPGLAYESRLDDGPWHVCPGFWFALFIDLPAGPHRFYVRAVDADGVRSQVSRYDWVVEPLRKQRPVSTTTGA